MEDSSDALGVHSEVLHRVEPLDQRLDDLASQDFIGFGELEVVLFELLISDLLESVGIELFLVVTGELRAEAVTLDYAILVLDLDVDGEDALGGSEIVDEWRVGIVWLARLTADHAQLLHVALHLAVHLYH